MTFGEQVQILTFTVQTILLSLLLCVCWCCCVWFHYYWIGLDWSWFNQGAFARRVHLIQALLLSHTAESETETETETENSVSVAVSVCSYFSWYCHIEPKTKPKPQPNVIYVIISFFTTMRVLFKMLNSREQLTVCNAANYLFEYAEKKEKKYA